MKQYIVEFKMWNYQAEPKKIVILANNKNEAYDKAVYDRIPATEGEFPYSAWVSEVKYASGRTQTFNTFEGKPV